MATYIARKIEKLKAKEEKLLAEARHVMQPEMAKLEDIQQDIRRFSKSLKKAIPEEIEGGRWDRLFLEKHNEMSKIVQSVSSWGRASLKFDATLGTIELISGDSKSRTSESEENPEVEMKMRVFKVKLAWNRFPHPLGVAEATWRDELVNDQLVYIAGSDSKMVIAIDK